MQQFTNYYYGAVTISCDSADIDIFEHRKPIMLKENMKVERISHPTKCKYCGQYGKEFSVCEYCGARIDG